MNIFKSIWNWITFPQYVLGTCHFCKVEDFVIDLQDGDYVCQSCWDHPIRQKEDYVDNLRKSISGVNDLMRGQKEAFGVEREPVEVVLDAGHDRSTQVSPSVWRWNDPTRVRRDLEDEWVKLYQKANDQVK